MLPSGGRASVLIVTGDTIDGNAARLSTSRRSGWRACQSADGDGTGVQRHQRCGQRGYGSPAPADGGWRQLYVKLGSRATAAAVSDRRERRRWGIWPPWIAGREETVVRCPPGAIFVGRRLGCRGVPWPTTADCTSPCVNGTSRNASPPSTPNAAISSGLSSRQPKVLASRNPRNTPQPAVNGRGITTATRTSVS